MRPDDFDFICQMLSERSGLVLNKDKGYLLESRLTPVAQRHGLAGLDALIAELRSGGGEALKIEVTEAMTTNESFFFRDDHVFVGFRDSILPRMMEARAAQRHLRIWCAAASSGQEPYTIAMILKEAGAKLDGWKCEIIGTDISNDILEKANEGLYSQFEVQRGLPVQLLVKYFEKDDQMWRIAPEIKAMVRYREFNLLDDMAMLGSFDIVFCRNVLIYFDQANKGEILGRIAKRMPADGTLILGGAETVVGISDQFVPDPNHRGVYCKSEAGQRAAVATYTVKPVAAAPGLVAPAPLVSAPRPAAPATAALAASSPLSTIKPLAPRPATPAPAAATPAPAKPTFAAPAPAAPTPTTPAPATPAPAKPTFAAPAPAAPTPTTPAPATPAPTKPTFAAPAPAAPTPMTPAPAKPAPTIPAPTIPAPATPAAASAAAPLAAGAAGPSPAPLASTPPTLAKPPAPAGNPAPTPNTSAPAKPDAAPVGNSGLGDPRPLGAGN